MGVLTLLVLIVGGFLSGLITVAAIVAGWEWLRQREALEMVRRDRAVYALTSPLPLGAAARTGGEATSHLRPGASAASVIPESGSPGRRGSNWIETRPMVLSCAPAVDDETAVHQREPDLLLD